MPEKYPLAFNSLYAQISEKILIPKQINCLHYQFYEQP